MERLLAEIRTNQAKMDSLSSPMDANQENLEANLQ
jgi:hypothetical protein